MMNNFSEIGIYSKKKSLTITDHKFFEIDFDYSISKNTNQEGFYLSKFSIKDQIIFERKNNKKNIFIYYKESFSSFFNVIVNFLNQVNSIYLKRYNEKDLNIEEKERKKKGLNNLTTHMLNNIQLLYCVFVNYKELLDNEYGNIYDFFILKSAFHVYKTEIDQYCFHFKTNEYNNHEVYFLSNNYLEYGFHEMQFNKYSDALNWFFDDYKLFSFIKRINHTRLDNQKKQLVKNEIFKYIDDLTLIESSRKYFIKDIYKKGQEE